MWEMWDFFKNVDKILKMWEMWNHWAPCEPVFELTLAPSEKKPTNECRSDSGIELLC